MSDRRSLVPGLAVVVLLALLFGVAAARSRTGFPQGSVAFDLQFAGGKPAGGWIEVASLDGSGRRMLTAPPSGADHRVDEALSWSPDGTRLAFLRTQAGGRSGLYVVNRDGSGLRRLRARDGGLGAVWSPDGSRIASWSPGNECGYPQGHVAPRLWISSVAGSGSVELPPLLDAGARPGRNNSGGAVAWSGDGRKLLYSIDQYLGGGECRLQNPPSLLYTIDATGRNRHKVVDHGGSSGTIFDAVWAPDGQAVAFLALDGVYMKPLTGELRLVFPLANVNLGDPYGLTWLQPQELVFTSPGALRIADPQSTSQRVLMRARYLQLVASSAESQEVAVADANDTVTVISLDGKKRWRIPRSPGRVPHAALSGVTIYLR